MATKKENSDLIELLLCLVDAKVDLLIVGGHAVAFHHEPRYTKDIDIWVDCSPKNAEKVYLALKQYGAPVQSVDSTFFTFKDHFLKIGREPLRADIICGMEGLDFIKAWKRRVKGELFGVKVNYIHIKDLIKLKKLAGRPQDLVDVDNLLRLKIHKKRK
jgi:predicted nucleotidyltransferase